MNPETIIKFWFEETKPAQWFKKDAQFDAQIREKFLDTYWHVVKGEAAEWRKIPEGRLAEIIVLDQFSRNIFRDSPQAFATDPQALSLAEAAVAAGDDKRLPFTMRRFLYMPYMHSESQKAHKKALRLFFSPLPGRWGWFRSELQHKRIIDRFGRYPHRNAILGRESTAAEKQFLLTHKGF